MTRQQLRVLIGMGALVVVLLLAVVAAGSGGRTRSRRAASAPTSSTVVPAIVLDTPFTGTTVDLLPVPSSPTTAAPVASHATVPTTAGLPTTTTSPPPRVLSAQGAFLAKPASATTRTGDPSDCATFEDPGWGASCALVQTAGGELLWMVESRPAGNGAAWRVAVMSPAAPGTGSGTWNVLLSVDDDAGAYFSNIRVTGYDVEGHGSQDIVFGFHDLTGDVYVEVVGPGGRVTLHQGYTLGSVILAPGQIDCWDALQGSGNYERDSLRYLSGAWRVVAASVVAGPAPASQM